MRTPRYDCDMPTLNPDLLEMPPLGAHLILAAHRGPDDGPQDFKTRIVTPIRCFIWQCLPDVLERLGVAPGFSPPRTADDWSALAREACDSFPETPLHARQHAYWACMEIADWIAPGPRALWRRSD